MSLLQLEVIPTMAAWLGSKLPPVDVIVLVYVARADEWKLWSTYTTEQWVAMDQVVMKKAISADYPSAQMVKVCTVTGG